MFSGRMGAPSWSVCCIPAVDVRALIAQRALIPPQHLPLYLYATRFPQTSHFRRVRHALQRIPAHVDKDWQVPSNVRATTH